MTLSFVCLTEDEDMHGLLLSFLHKLKSEIVSKHISSILNNIYTHVIVCSVFSHVHKIKIQVSHWLSQDAFVVCDVMCTEVWISFYFQIALRRERMGETAPFWNFSAASYPDLERDPSGGALARNSNNILVGNAGLSLNGSNSSSSKV